MEARYQFTRISQNPKTGPIPTSILPKSGCPATCPYMDNGCYGDNFPLALHWDRISNPEQHTKKSGQPYGVSFNEYLTAISYLPPQQLWRDAVAGDQKHDPSTGKIDEPALRAKLEANLGKRGFTYSHHNMKLSHNRRMLRLANNSGFTINQSCNNPRQAATWYKRHKRDGSNIPVVTVAPISWDLTVNPKAPRTRMIDGVKFAVCPATYLEHVNCSNCGLCYQGGMRGFAIAFPAHGIKAQKADLIASSR